MAIIRWRPLADFEKFAEDINLLRHTIGRDLAADVYEENGNVIVKMHVPDINPDKLDISVEGDHLKVSGNREEETAEAERNYYTREIRTGSFERIIHLPAAVNKEKTRADIHDGVLTITLPKLNHDTARKITVEKH